jgi:Flp pilus assembly protein TadG
LLAEAFFISILGQAPKLEMIAVRHSRRDRRCHRSRRDGAAAVEFALVAPVLFLFIVLPMFEFGRALMVSELVTNAARDGARVGILPGNTNTAVTTAINADLSAQGITGATTTITVNGASADVSTAAQGVPVQVTVSVPFNNVAWIPGRFLGGMNLTGVQTLPHE